MSAVSERGWFFVEQPDAIVAQLDHGIRVLLVNSWYGQPTDRRTIVATAEKQRKEAFEQAKAELGAIARPGRTPGDRDRRRRLPERAAAVGQRQQRGRPGARCGLHL
jgi:hypothetical protein